MNNYYKNFPKILTICATVSLGGWIGKHWSKPDKRAFAEASSIMSEYPNLPQMTHNSIDGLYLTVTEKQGLQRQINFFDYGFDGKLDKVRINQNKRRETTVTNIIELLEWQPIFEKFRSRRFEKFDENKNQ